MCRQHGALPAPEVDRQLKEQEIKFLAEAGQVIDITPAEKEPARNRRDDEFLDETGMSG